MGLMFSAGFFCTWVSCLQLLCWFCGWNQLQETFWPVRPWERHLSQCECTYRSALYPLQVINTLFKHEEWPVRQCFLEMACSKQSSLFSHGLIISLQSAQYSIWQHASVDHSSAVCAASSTDSLPPAGLPQPGSEVGGTDEEGSRTYCCHWHSEEGQTLL